ncbi:MAG TPA: fibronectin type III domain-containing protein [Candidatus Polarisedimenticolaceae bacterium]|nr:fibronectin type III domain-containing protein [Candidatus Polarisedimenticolaceae bacterium]
MSLIEVLVATAVLALAVIVALTIYDKARQSFKKGENATEQQEAVRIAYDRLTADLRMLGYNTNPDGSPTRPDEQLEVALDHAIIFRGDFDADDPTKNNDVESAFAGGAFNVVSTGNDEVVGYVLEKPDGTGPDTITFQADVDDQPRDGNVATVTVNNVVLNPTSPPYTLYKISLSNNVGICCSGDFIVRTPVAENVRNLTFQYYDATSTAPIAAPGSTETAAAKTLRNGILKFNVSLIGMTKDKDINYNDTSDPASAQYRKFELRGDVVPRNMRMKGIQDINASTATPSKPATPTVLAGHCGGLLVTWAANPTADQVTQYRVNYGTAPGAILGTKNVSGSPFFLAGLTTGTTYYITVQAQNGAGNVSVKSNEVSAAVANTNTPSAPTGPTATSSLVNNVQVNWTAVTTNTANVPAGDPIAPGIRDLAGYRIYRGDVSGFTPAAANRIADETVVKSPLEPPHIDNTTVNCHTYYYKITAVDTCGLESTASSAVSGHATTSIAPSAPTNVQAFRMSTTLIAVTWTPVTTDVSSNPVTVAGYDVYRSNVVNKTDPVSMVVFPTTPLASTVLPVYNDNAPPAMTSLQTVYYMVKAKDECVNYSAASSLAQAICQFSGTVSFTTPANGATIAGVVPVTVTVTGGTDTYASVSIVYTHSVNGVTRSFTSVTPDSVCASGGTCWTDTGWLANPAGAYTITATVTNSSGCSSTSTISVNAGSAVGCCLSVFPTTTSTATCAGGSTKCKEVSYYIGDDRCLTSVSITTMTIAWVDYTNTKPAWQTAQFNATNLAAAGTWTTAYGSGTNPTGTATKSFGAGAASVPYATPTTAANATKVTYVFNNFTDNGNGSNRKVDVFGTNQFVFTLLDSAGNPSGITTTCNLPSLTVN